MKVYIYCTKARKSYRIIHLIFYEDELYKLPNGKIKFGSSVELMAYDNYDKNNFLNGKIVASFELNKVSKIEVDSKQYNYWSKNGSCLSIDDFINYCKGKDLYAWHIKNLEIIEPLELDEFYTFRKGYENQLHMHEKTLTKAPQSYRYAYYKGERVIILSVKAKWVEKILNGYKTIEVRKTAPKEMLK